VPPEERIDINHATLAELLRIPGITQTWAARIVRFRPYRTKLDLQDRGVVSDEVYDRIKEYIIAHREKTLRPSPSCNSPTQNSLYASAGALSAL
jgi:predicted DNA-binding helix-hairpin-helix protein